MGFQPIGSQQEATELSPIPSATAPHCAEQQHMFGKPVPELFLCTISFTLLHPPQSWGILARWDAGKPTAHLTQTVRQLESFAGSMFGNSAKTDTGPVSQPDRALTTFLPKLPQRLNGETVEKPSPSLPLGRRQPSPYPE